MTTLPSPDPFVHDDVLPFWEATREHRLVLPRCTTCQTIIWYPRGFCSACGTFDVEWIDAAGTGTVYSCTVARKGQGAYQAAAPYLVAYVDLDEGPRLITNLIDCDVEAVRIGDRVTVAFTDTESGYALPRFRPLA